ncbi:DoxX family protein [Streptomyces prasinus]|uniref:DoxX family protein n=1 Tax=Streptomyces prasinus TaxID=67345 RepID=A0ABX6ASC1_9ACTN|nr:DoxX family protein [Streptomyces prasinus]QEV04918.1 DoxX family protein [Streptomyces prasinus]
MFIATIVVSALLATLLVFSAIGKLRKDPAQLKVMQTVGFPADKLWLLATAEAAGAAGLLFGLLWWPLGVAAAIGVILYFIGAVGSHLRVRDPATNAAIPLVLAIAALTLRLATT